MKRGFLFIIVDEGMSLFHQPLYQCYLFSVNGCVKTIVAFVGGEEGVQPLHNVKQTIVTRKVECRESIHIEMRDVNEIKGE
jgi:hypothetical protein